MNNGLIYKFDHYEDDFSDLTFEYGCMTGNTMFLFYVQKPVRFLSKTSNKNDHSKI